jgi:small subunit ribosomal protein S21
MRRRRAFETPTERKRRKARTAIKRHRVRWRYVSEATEKKIAERKAAAAATSEGHSHS